MAPRPRKQTGMAGHELLLRMAGRIPDRSLAQARLALAEGRAPEAIAPLADLLTETPILLTAGEIAAIRGLSSKTDALPGAEAVADPLPLSFGFATLDQFGEIDRDEIDEALVAAVQGHEGSVAAIWRSWRYQVQSEAPTGEPLATLLPEDPADPYRVYIVQVESSAKIDEVTSLLLRAVPDPASTAIEVIALGAEPPVYQQAALSESLLLWSAHTEPEFTVARVFDFADPVAGPGFTPDHPVIDDPERRQSLLDYLRNGEPVLMTTATMQDIVDPEAGSVVPGSFRTDGSFIWTDAVPYYLDQHGLTPDAQLTEHIEAQIARGHAAPGADKEAAIRAAEYLLNPPLADTRKAVWYPDGDAARTRQG